METLQKITGIFIFSLCLLNTVFAQQTQTEITESTLLGEWQEVKIESILVHSNEWENDTTSQQGSHFFVFDKNNRLCIKEDFWDNEPQVGKWSIKGKLLTLGSESEVCTITLLNDDNFVLEPFFGDKKKKRGNSSSKKIFFKRLKDTPEQKAKEKMLLGIWLGVETETIYISNSELNEKEDLNNVLISFNDDHMGNTSGNSDDSLLRLKWFIYQDMLTLKIIDADDYMATYKVIKLTDNELIIEKEKYPGSDKLLRIKYKKD